MFKIVDRMLFATLDVLTPILCKPSCWFYWWPIDSYITWGEGYRGPWFYKDVWESDNYNSRRYCFGGVDILIAWAKRQPMDAEGSLG